VNGPRGAHGTGGRDAGSPVSHFATDAFEDVYFERTQRGATG
jgi:hypothetical protein